jgi:hypothetical protein
MYTFTEGMFLKNANSICTFILDAILKEFRPEHKEIVLHSDNCFGQNKNFTMMKFTTLLSKTFNVKVSHLFPVVGHSYSVCNRNFSSHTRRLKSIQTVEVPDEYFKIINANNKFIIRDSIID